MENKRNVVGWFEIPVSDIDRAVKFYNELFGFELEAKGFGDSKMAMFPMDMEADNPGAGGALFLDKHRKPSSNGTLIYFTSPTGDCANEEKKAEEMGAKVIMKKFEIPEGHGFMIMVEDSEGNNIAIHSLK